jgi:hypothetical protein
MQRARAIGCSEPSPWTTVHRQLSMTRVDPTFGSWSEKRILVSVWAVK